MHTHTPPQIDYHKKMQEGFVDLLPKLEGLDVNEGGGGGVVAARGNNVPPSKPGNKGGRKGGGETEGLLSESTLIGV